MKTPKSLSPIALGEQFHCNDWAAILEFGGLQAKRYCSSMTLQLPGVTRLRTGEGDPRCRALVTAVLWYSLKFKEQKCTQKLHRGKHIVDVKTDLKKRQTMNKLTCNKGKHFCIQLKQSLAQLMIHAPMCFCSSCSHEKAIIGAHYD